MQRLADEEVKAALRTGSNSLEKLRDGKLVFFNAEREELEDKLEQAQKDLAKARTAAQDAP